MNQTDLLLKLMVRDGHVTKIAADSYRVGNIKGRICDLRHAHWSIQTEFAEDATGKRYARYSLCPEAKRLATEYLTAKGYLDKDGR